MIITIVLTFTGCGQGPSMSINTAKSHLEKEGFTPINLRYSMNFPRTEMPWICICAKEDNQYITVINSKKDFKQVQIGTEQYLSLEEIQDKLVSLGYEKNEYLINNLNVDLSENDQLYWFFPVESSGSLLFFSLDGKRINH